MRKKVALILGGNGGIGSAVIRQLSKDGFQVCTTYNKNKDQIESIKLTSGELQSYKCNITDKEMVDKTIRSINALFGEIDVVIFSAASNFKNNRILDLDWNEYSSQFDLQTKSMFLVMKALSKQIALKYKTKFIVVLSEVSQGQPPKGFSPYVTSKYAAMGMAKTMALELAPFDCRVNMISPGMVETKLLSDLPTKMIEISSFENPLKKNALPEDIAKVASFLLSDDAEFINGANIPVNGGKVLF
jgi:3-oxoacyl-[acyl-carrier protein] reductase